jgi:transposase
LDAEAKIAELTAQVLARDVVIAELRAEILRLNVVVQELTEKVSQNSRNSHKPPSMDPPGSRAPGRGSPGKRKRGGQKGHRGNHRELLPADQVDEVKDLFPPACENCWKPLPEVPDADATRTQMTEVPPIKPHVKEFRQHAVACVCGHVTRATGEGVIPSSPFGPRLMALVVLFTGIYHLSRRRTIEILNDILGVRLSLGAASAIEGRVSEALEPAFTQIIEKADCREVHGFACGPLPLPP